MELKQLNDSFIKEYAIYQKIAKNVVINNDIHFLDEHDLLQSAYEKMLKTVNNIPFEYRFRSFKIIVKKIYFKELYRYNKFMFNQFDNCYVNGIDEIFNSLKHSTYNDYSQLLIDDIKYHLKKDFKNNDNYIKVFDYMVKDMKNKEIEEHIGTNPDRYIKKIKEYVKEYLQA